MSSNIPTFVPLKKTDYGSDGLGSQEALDKFFTQMNSQFDSIKAAMNGGMTFGNFGGDEWEITVKTPASDWTAVTAFTNSWAAWGAAPYFDPAYRRRPDGVVELRGLMKSGVIGSAAFTLPTGFWPSAQPVFCVISNGAIGRLDVSSVGVVTPVAGNNAYVSLDGVAFAEAANTAGVLSCFPINVRCKDNAKVKDVFLTAVIDSAQGDSPGVAPGSISWCPTQQLKTGFPNTFTIKNIAGLALGRTYKVRGVVLYE